MLGLFLLLVSPPPLKKSKIILNDTQMNTALLGVEWITVMCVLNLNSVIYHYIIVYEKKFWVTANTLPTHYTTKYILWYDSLQVSIAI